MSKVVYLPSKRSDIAYVKLSDRTTGIQIESARARAYVEEAIEKHKLPLRMAGTLYGLPFYKGPADRDVWWAAGDDGLNATRREGVRADEVQS